jgi:tetratricopeptide (TPR) repeat protein
VALNGLGLEDEAIRTLNEFAAENPKMAWAHIDHALLLYNAGHLEESLVALGKAVEAESTNPWPYVYRAGPLLHRAESCEQGLADVSRALEMAPQNAWIWARAAQALAEGAARHCPEHFDPTRTLELARKAADQGSENEHFQYVLGMALLRAGAYENAYRVHRRAWELEGQFDDKAFNLLALSIVSSRLGRHAEARSFYDQGLAAMKETRPESPQLISLREEAAELLGVQP